MVVGTSHLSGLQVSLSLMLLQRSVHGGNPMSDGHANWCGRTLFHINVSKSTETFLLCLPAPSVIKKKPMSLLQSQNIRKNVTDVKFLMETQLAYVRGGGGVWNGEGGELN